MPQSKTTVLESGGDVYWIIFSICSSFFVVRVDLHGPLQPRGLYTAYKWFSCRLWGLL